MKHHVFTSNLYAEYACKRMCNLPGVFEDHLVELHILPNGAKSRNGEQKAEKWHVEHSSMTWLFSNFFRFWVHFTF